jgi:ATP/ADP translocase
VSLVAREGVVTYLRGLLPAKPGERKLALLLYMLLTLMVLADWVGKVGADSLFVKRLGVQYIPTMYIVTPIAMLTTSALLFALVDRVRRRALLFYYCLFVAVASVAIRRRSRLAGSCSLSPTSLRTA